MFLKKDLILIMTIIAVAALSALLMALVQRDAGASVRITIDGKLYGEYSLSENRTVTVDEPSGYNRIVIRDGSACMEEADCPDKYCMDYKPVSKGGQTIICLPHRLVVEVAGERDGQQPDVIVP